MDLNPERLLASTVPSPGIPFLIRLGRLTLWTCPNAPQAKVNVGYRLDVMVKANQVLKVGATDINCAAEGGVGFCMYRFKAILPHSRLLTFAVWVPGKG
jgi:hypothetical protein